MWPNSRPIESEHWSKVICWIKRNDSFQFLVLFLYQKWIFHKMLLHVSIFIILSSSPCQAKTVIFHQNQSLDGDFVSNFLIFNYFLLPTSACLILWYSHEKTTFCRRKTQRFYVKIKAWYSNYNTLSKSRQEMALWMKPQNLSSSRNLALQCR